MTKRRVTDGEVDRAVDLIHKRVRVWYKSERKWRVATVASIAISEHTEPSGVFFRVKRLGKANPGPWYYGWEELRPLKGTVFAHRARRRVARYGR